MDSLPGTERATEPATPAASPIRVVLIEDDSDLRESLSDLIGLAGFAVLTGGSALEFYQILASQEFDIVLLDVGLPDQDGFSIVRHLKAHGHRHGIILLTARDGTEDRIEGFQHGADLYFTKPADSRELVAAITSLAARLRLSAPPPPAASSAAATTQAASSSPPADGVDSPTGWLLNHQHWCLQTPSGVTIAMTSQEMRILASFADATDSVATRSILLGAIGKNPLEIEDRSLDAAIRRLRRKVEQTTGMDLPLKTIPTKGYIFTAPLRQTPRP